jgi:hypothetical protein
MSPRKLSPSVISVEWSNCIGPTRFLGITETVGAHVYYGVGSQQMDCDVNS